MPTQSGTDFSGFIDGFKARNLAVIQRTVTPQLSEMQTRLSVLKGLVQRDNESKSLSAIISQIEEAFRSTEDVVHRLMRVGQGLNSLVISEPDHFNKSPELKKQLAGLALAFVEAAEGSRSDRLIDIATKVADAYENAFPPNPEVKKQVSEGIFEGDALKILTEFPTKRVQCVITSPPYWGVRDYFMEGQIGLESDLDIYISNLVAVFREVKRILRDDGVMWVNVGDVYASGNRKYRAPDRKYPQRALKTRPATPRGSKPKDLIGVPWKVAFALRDDGWFLRTEVIWQKPNAIPESVRDRPARGHEYLFLFSKSKTYKFSRRRLESEFPDLHRSVWKIPTARSNVTGHHAAFPARLVMPCLIASTSKNDVVMDPFCGTGTVGRVCSVYQRKFLGIEINPTYASAAKKGWPILNH